MTTIEELTEEFITHIGDWLGEILQTGYRQGEKDALKRVSEQDEEMLRIEKEKAYNQGWINAAKLLKEVENSIGNGDFICKKLAEWMDPPCSYGFGDLEVSDFMADSGWCEEHCEVGSEIYEICWRKFFEMLKKVEDHG